MARTLSCASDVERSSSLRIEDPHSGVFLVPRYVRALLEQLDKLIEDSRIRVRGSVPDRVERVVAGGAGEERRDAHPERIPGSQLGDDRRRDGGEPAPVRVHEVAQPDRVAVPGLIRAAGAT
jgi:hypothetical protein